MPDESRETMLLPAQSPWWPAWRRLHMVMRNILRPAEGVTRRQQLSTDYLKNYAREFWAALRYSRLPMRRPVTARELRRSRDMRLATVRLLHEVSEVKLASHHRLQLERLSGAMSNMVYMCTAPDMPAILMRLYGDGSDMFFDRELELSIFRFMSDIGLGPRLLGTFSGGRFEEFLDAEPLTAPDLCDPRTSCKIARAMARLHAAPQTTGTSPDLPGQDPTASSLWKRLDSWRDKARPVWQRWVAGGHSCGRLDVPVLLSEIKVLRDLLAGQQTQIVFCHNDLQYGNIMKMHTDNSLILIDYEYAGYGDRGFDIGNHFCEWAANYHSDVPHALNFERYPTEEQQARFVRAYLNEYRLVLAGGLSIPTSPGVVPQSPPSNSQDVRQTGDSPSSPSDASSASADEDVSEINLELVDDEVKGVMHEANVFALASHLHWALWGLIQGMTSQIEFDFFEYASQRMDRYIAMRDILFKDRIEPNEVNA